MFSATNIFHLSYQKLLEEEAPYAKLQKFEFLVTFWKRGTSLKPVPSS